MTVYVDNARLSSQQAQIRNPRLAVWCHLTADDPDELSEFALSLGLYPNWLRGRGTEHEHYLIPLSKRREALAMGAVFSNPPASP